MYRTDFSDLPKFLREPHAPRNKDETKTWNGREFYWCGTSTGGQCNAWRMHKGEVCQGKNYIRNRNKGKTQNSERTNGDKSDVEKRSPPNQDGDEAQVTKKTRFHNALEARIRENPTGSDDISFIPP